MLNERRFTGSSAVHDRTKTRGGVRVECAAFEQLNERKRWHTLVAQLHDDPFDPNSQVHDSTEHSRRWRLRRRFCGSRQELRWWHAGRILVRKGAMSLSGMGYCVTQTGGTPLSLLSTETGRLAQLWMGL